MSRLPATFVSARHRRPTRLRRRVIAAAEISIGVVGGAVAYLSATGASGWIAGLFL